MSRIHALLDTTALVKRYYPQERQADLVLELFARKQTVTIHFCDICIPEVRNVFYRLSRQGDMTPTERDKALRLLRRHLVEGRLMYIHHITDRNVIDTEKIAKSSWYGLGTNLTQKQKRHPRPLAGPTDQLVIAAARHLKRVLKGFALVTDDTGLAEVAKRFGIEVWLLRQMSMADIRKKLVVRYRGRAATLIRNRRSK